MTRPAQQAEILEQMAAEKFQDAQKASNHQTFAEELREEGRALQAGAAALRSSVPETREDQGAGLIGQPIPDMAGTEPRLTIEEAREKIMVAADKLTQVWDVSKANGWQQLGPAIDALIAAVRAEAK